MMDTQQIDIELIDQNESQPRKYFDKDKLEALKKSIKKDGLLQPVVIRSMKETGRYQLIAGECRYRALKELGEKTVPAVVVDADDKKALDLALLENEVRSDLTPLEKAEAIEAYKKRHNTSYEKIADTLGMSPSNVSNITSLNKLDPKIKEELRKEPSIYPLRSLMTIARNGDFKKQRAAFSALKTRLNNKDLKKSKTVDAKEQKDTNKELFQRVNQDLETLSALNKHAFESLVPETEALSKNLSNLLNSLLALDFNALKFDDLKATIINAYSLISNEGNSENC